MNWGINIKLIISKRHSPAATVTTFPPGTPPGQVAKATPPGQAKKSGGAPVGDGTLTAG